MKLAKLGRSDIQVSQACLGSMTWGVQNSQQEASQQIEYALSQGINFIDTAEMYAIPPTAQTYGTTETIIGNWLKNNPANRKELIITTKITGPGLPWIRDGGPISGETVIAAVDASLKRLQTDYIDLYQLHWPNRTSPHFGKHHPNKVSFSEFDTRHEEAQMLDILQGLGQCVRAGKIRYCGLSDETPWGINTYLTLSEKHDLPRMVSIQNEFSLLHAKDWPYLVEYCIHADLAYLPWSPLAGGMLSGKYLNGARPAGSRWSISQRNGLFRDTPLTNSAIALYAEIATKYGYTPCQLALAWCAQVDGVTSPIIGATSMAQLKENISAFSMPLSQEALADIERVFKKHPLPF